VQQIRDLEALGVIARAPRAANGYRRFSRLHVRDLRAYRELATAVGPVRARHAMREIRVLPRGRAAALVNSFHVALDRERDAALAARQALEMIRAEAAADAEPAGADSMTITELAGALGVRASTLRFWEKAGLVRPERVTGRAGAARRYPLPAIREARITAALRAAGYRIPDVRRTMAAVRHLHDLDDPLKALDSHVETITRRTLALLRAGTDLADIIAGPRDQPVR
jgi:DNA-binding transcriptional MerR regulator